MDEQFEKKLNDSVQESSAPIKTTADQILSAYHEKEKEKKHRSYKAPFFGALGALACAVVALAVLIPNAFAKGTPGVSSIGDDVAVSEISVSPLKNDHDVLGYEVAALYPLVSGKNSTSVAGLFGLNSSLSPFAQAVENYEAIEAPIRSTFLGAGESLTLESVSYSGSYGTYTNKLSIPAVGDLYFNATSYGGRWSVLTGELVDGSVVRRFEGAQKSNDSGSSAFGLKLYENENGDYALVEQNESQGRFYFSFQFFNGYQLTTSLSLRLMRADGDYPFIIANHFSSSDYATTTFKVLAASSNLYTLYGTGLGKISLLYQNSQRIYTNNGITITK
jgi:hypothetical protein